MLGILLERSGYDVTVEAGVKAALRRLDAERPFEAVITDLLMPDGSGMDVLEAARAHDQSTQVLMITAYATTEQAVEAMRKGAYDYVQKPFKNDALLATLEKAVEKRRIVAENRALRAEVEGTLREGDLVGRSQAMRDLRAFLERAARARSSVLITGESGTGKELVARALHYGGPRAAQDFVVVNCGALPEALMESELFGHERGAFTGAVRAELGLFRAADGGTLLLDEVGELPPGLQVKLLRALQERAVRPVGGRKEVPVDVRVVAATNRDLERAVEAGEFREDLFYRLNVLRVHVPPLRERREDIPLLAEHLLTKHAALAGRALELSPEARAALTRRRFPGNVRELENVIERAVALTPGEILTPQDLGPVLESASAPCGPELPAEGLDLEAHLASIESRLLRAALERSGGVQTRAAALLGMSFRQFRYRLAKHASKGRES
ncbi:MAG: sigma-54-dependent Fis family transcriptional regulator [Deltaproteobacteria bacterium]|nr:sigma-54-dependent Fis family transcriptional regulator [Deltaproteobacteria bacterium]